MTTNKFTTNLIERLKLAESFSQIVPQTMEGKTIYDAYNKMFETEMTVSGFHNFMLECMNISDRTMKQWATQTSNMISMSNPNSWRFNLILEKLSMSGQPINESIVDDLKYLGAFNEADLSEAIANGALSNNQMIGEFKNLYESICGTKGTRQLLENNVMFNPISYVESKNGSKFLMIEGHIYEDSESGLTEAQAPSATFVQTNAAIQSIPYNPDVDEFELTFLPGAVNVTSSGNIVKDKEAWDIQRLQDEITKVSEGQPEHVKIQESRKFDALVNLLEHWDSVIRLNNVTSIHNTVSGATASLVEHANMNYVITKTGIQSASKSLNESVHQFNKIIGINLRGLFKKQLLEEMNDNQTKQSINEKLNADIENYNTIVKQCSEELAFCNAGTPKFKELQSIKESAEDVLKVLVQTEKQLK